MSLECIYMSCRELLRDKVVGCELLTFGASAVVLQVFGFKCLAILAFVFVACFVISRCLVSIASAT